VVAVDLDILGHIQEIYMVAVAADLDLMVLGVVVVAEVEQEVLALMLAAQRQ
jgi:hypothetical protein